MDYNCVILTLFPEICLKSEPVRKFYQTKLKKSILSILQAENISASLQIVHGRAYVKTETPLKVIEALKNCFGILSLSPAVEGTFSEKDFDEFISTKVLDFCLTNFLTKKDSKKEFTFAGRGKSLINSISTKQLECALGDVVLTNYPNAKVKLKGPEKELSCILTKEKFYLFSESFDGANGFPVGSQGRAILVCSSEKKSTQTLDDKRLAFLLLKSGCLVSSVGKIIDPKKELQKFNAGKEIQELSKAEAISLLEERRALALFSASRNSEDITKIAKDFGVKPISAFLFLDLNKTPFDE